MKYMKQMYFHGYVGQDGLGAMNVDCREAFARSWAGVLANPNSLTVAPSDKVVGPRRKRRVLMLGQ